MTIDQDELLEMSRHQLDDLYGRSRAGPIPNGSGRGVAIAGPAGRFAKTFARLTYLFAWQGKNFDGVRRLVNRITPLRVAAIEAEVYSGPSRFDGKECIVIDYTRTSTVARWIRDEIRNVSPGLYLGFAYWGKRRLIAFSLYFSDDALKT